MQDDHENFYRLTEIRYKTIGTISAGSRNIKIAEAEETRNYLGEPKYYDLKM